MKKKQIVLFTDQSELKDFEFIKKMLNRKTDSDTIRAMIALCKKILKENTAIAVNNII